MAKMEENPKDAVRQPSAAKTESVHPVSMHLEKSVDIPRETIAATPPAKTEIPASAPEARQKPPGKPEKIVVGPSTWVIFLALFLLPFFFHAGTELYMLGRAALLNYVGMENIPFGNAPQSASSLPGDNKDRQILDSMTAIILNQQKQMEQGGQKVVIFRPEYPGAYSFEAEKTKIYELSGMDIDDPVTGMGKMSKINSAEVLMAMIESFDRITLNAAQYNTSEFHIKNAIESKKLAFKRLQELK